MRISIEPGAVVAEAPQARIDPGAARRAIDRVRGMPAADALAVLTRPGPGTCEPVARVLQGATGRGGRPARMPRGHLRGAGRRGR